MTTSITAGASIGIMGGGQLGRMLAIAAANLGYRTHIFCPEADCPASHVAERSTIAAYTDENALMAFARSVDVITFEFENIPHTSVQVLESHSLVRPNWRALHVSQNRLREKNFVQELGIGTAPFLPVSSLEDLHRAVEQLGRPCILKTTELGYDGKGQYVIKPDTSLPQLASELSLEKAAPNSWILEGFVRFTKEISVIVARNPEGEMACYAPVENKHVNGILDTTIAPALLPAKIASTAEDYAKRIAGGLGLIGLLAVEFFLTDKGEILVNEMAPRPHNSGHWSLDGAITSQFEQCIRAICNLPFGAVAAHSKAVMKNLIGDEVYAAEGYLKDPYTKLHLYGKKEAKPGRKMGHVTTLRPLHE